jgi:ribosomal protein S18 acetylase RimI-like enzyme
MRQELSDVQRYSLPALPSPCTLQPFDSSHSQHVYQVYQESFQDDWLLQVSSFPAWQELWINKPNFLPKLSFIAFAENELIGFLLTEEHSTENIRTAHINILGIKPSWRNRGIAKYLLHYALHAFHANGFAYATLDADPDSPYNVVEFYQKANFTPIRMKVYFGKLIENQPAYNNVK